SHRSRLPFAVRTNAPLRVPTSTRTPLIACSSPGFRRCPAARTAGGISAPTPGHKASRTTSRPRDDPTGAERDDATGIFAAMVAQLGPAPASGCRTRFAGRSWPGYNGLRKSAPGAHPKCKAGRPMPTRKLTPEQLAALEELAQQWGKIVAN